VGSHYILIFIVVVLALAFIYFLKKTIEKHDYGNAAAALATLIGIGITVYFALPNSNSPTTSVNGTVDLEINEKAEQSQLRNPHFQNIIVLNRGTLTAQNSYLQIEYCTSNNKSYKFVGYSCPWTDNPVQIMPHTETSFTLVRTMSDNGTLETCLWLKEIRDFAESKSNPVNYYYLPVGTYYLRLTVVADNGQSAPREFVLRVMEDQIPTIEFLK
jgi:hypothetical protein